MASALKPGIFIEKNESNGLVGKICKTRTTLKVSKDRRFLKTVRQTNPMISCFEGLIISIDILISYDYICVYFYCDFNKNEASNHLLLL